MMNCDIFVRKTDKVSVQSYETMTGQNNVLRLEGDGGKVVAYFNSTEDMKTALENAFESVKEILRVRSEK